MGTHQGATSREHLDWYFSDRAARAQPVGRSTTRYGIVASHVGTPI